MKCDVVCAGDINIDIILASTHETPQFGREISLPKMEVRIGGSTANTVTELAKLGLKACLIGKIPEDVFGHYLIEKLQEIGVECLLPETSHKERTGITVSVVHKSGDRAMITYPGTNAKLSYGNVQQHLKTLRGKHFHLGGFFLLESLKGKPVAEIFKEAKKTMTTSLDPGWDIEGWTKQNLEALYATLKHVNIFFPNESEALMTAQTQNLAKARETILTLGPKIVVTKLGEKGCYVATEEKMFHTPAFKIRAVETTGAGDVFNAAFIYGFLKGWELRNVAVFANAVGAMRISSIKQTYPALKMVTDFLKERGVGFDFLAS